MDLIRAYSRLKFNLGVLKVPSTEKFMQTEVDHPYVCEFTSRNINFPEPKLKKKCLQQIMQ